MLLVENFRCNSPKANHTFIFFLPPPPPQKKHFKDWIHLHVCFSRHFWFNMNFLELDLYLYMFSFRWVKFLWWCARLSDFLLFIIIFLESQLWQYIIIFEGHSLFLELIWCCHLFHVFKITTCQHSTGFIAQDTFDPSLSHYFIYILGDWW